LGKAERGGPDSGGGNRQKAGFGEKSAHDVPWNRVFESVLTCE
jgi:hypothetical protein